MRFDRIQRLDQPAMTTRWQADIGTVTIENNSARFDGKKPLLLPNIISVERVNSRAFAHDLIQVNYADGQTIVTVYFAVAYRRGGAQAIDELFGTLSALCGSSPPVAVAPQVIDAHRERILADRAQSNRQANTTMLIGAIVFVVGIVVTVGTYVSAVSTGGVYVIAYGAVFGGLAMILGGFAMKQKSSG
jgi:hypothetical protein